MLGSRLLIVDDEAQALNVLREIFTTAGYEVDTAFTAAIALELIWNNIYAAAFVDCNLSDMSGVMLHGEICKIEPELARRTIFMSDLVQSQSSCSYYDSVGAGFLSKPLDVWPVVALISALTGAVPLREAPENRWQAAEGNVVWAGGSLAVSVAPLTVLPDIHG